MKKQKCNWLTTWLLVALATAAWLVPQNTIATTWTVRSLSDSGTNSLRDIIAASVSDDTIEFSVSGTITLTSGEIVIDRNLTIIGPSAGLIFSGDYRSRVLKITAGTVNIWNVHITRGFILGRDGNAGTASTPAESGENVQGAGIFNSGTLNLMNCTLSDNHLTAGNGGYADETHRGPGGNGGNSSGAAIYNEGPLAMWNCTVPGNFARGGYGGQWGGNEGVETTIIRRGGNGGSAFGGGIYNAFSRVSLQNCTLSGNHAGGRSGGDAGPSYGGNGGNAEGGGVYQEYNISFSYRTSPINTIIADNVAGGGDGGAADHRGQSGTNSGWDVAGEFTSRGHNLIGTPYGSTGWQVSDQTGGFFQVLDPLLGSLWYNGGSTLTMALQSDSPAIDAGDDTVTNTIPTDQRGRPRKSGAHVDIGAFELSPPPLVTNTNDSGIGSLRDAILVAAPGDAVNFASNVTGTITLTSGELVLDKYLNINGPGAKVLTVSGNNASRVFHITGNASQISDLGIANGRASAGGGGIAMDGGSLTMNNCAITDCYAEGMGMPSQGGGAIAVVGTANLAIIASTLSSNTTPYYGGGIYLFNGPNVSLVNSTVSGNSTFDGTYDEAWGGGIFVANGSTLNITNSTIANNSSVSQGGGVYKGFSGTVTLRNSLVAGNSAGGLGPDCKGTFVSAGYNLIGNSSGSTGFGSTGDQLNLNAQIRVLADNGGPNFTHALLAGSPAIDKGGSGGPTTDQRGRARPYDFSLAANASGGDGSDIGAFELNPPVLSIARSAGNVLVSWPVYDTGYTLEAKTNLSPSINWSNVAGTPAVVAGQFTVTNTATAGDKFYRLRSP